MRITRIEKNPELLEVVLQPVVMIFENAAVLCGDVYDFSVKGFAALFGYFNFHKSLSFYKLFTFPD